MLLDFVNRSRIVCCFSVITTLVTRQLRVAVLETIADIALLEALAERLLDVHSWAELLGERGNE
ncbi:MAG TPA: hypothetical protein VMV69_25140 [Pirellulales bacterium]|nr:hypothetical protein [Pirellulales bacterium]